MRGKYRENKCLSINCSGRNSCVTLGDINLILLYTALDNKRYDMQSKKSSENWKDSISFLHVWRICERSLNFQRDLQNFKTRFHRLVPYYKSRFRELKQIAICMYSWESNMGSLGRANFFLFVGSKSFLVDLDKNYYDVLVRNIKHFQVLFAPLFQSLNTSYLF